MTIWGIDLGELPVERVAIVRALLQLAVGLGLAWGLARLARRVATNRFSPAQAEVAGRLAFWLIASIGVASSLSELGFDLSFLMGAAGLVTVALGFASQTSASNLISGLFLLFERPFAIRDIIEVGTTSGEVVSIDLLSVRLRTFDNRLVRVPNETLLKSDIINLSHFPVRRFDALFVVPHQVDLQRLRQQLLDLAQDTTAVLDEPEPRVIFSTFHDNGVELQLSVWFVRETYYDERTHFAFALHRRLAEVGVRFALPQRMVHQAPVEGDVPRR